jgi:ATP/maltotriose-dependent transcriptional regulator MalT
LSPLNTGAPAVGAGALALLQPPQPPNEAGLVALLNDLDAVSDDVVLVLDDYHVIDARDVQDGMAFLLEHLPPQIHLVIASRTDPPLPLARLRGRGELAEIRAADLRFTPGEAATYLNEVMGLVLTAADVAALEGRTEGWIAALQLAALSMQGREDTAAFIDGFAGDDRYIVDFLAEEVLQRQPEHVQHFLLQTSILDRLSGPLCDAVTGQDGGKAKLAALERGNLFLVPLDDRRQWYRYHQLFADVLHARLLDEQPDDVPELHRRASGWHEQNGEPSEAIRHALAAQDFGRAADLVELAIPAMRRSRQEAAVLGWLELLPDEVVGVRPVLSVGFAGMLLAGGEFEGVEARLRDAERWLDGATGIRRGSPAPAAEMAGHSGYAECMAGLRRAGHIADTFGCAIALADIRRTQGRLGEAMRTYEQALQRATQQGGPVVLGRLCLAADQRLHYRRHCAPALGSAVSQDEPGVLDQAHRVLVASAAKGKRAPGAVKTLLPPFEPGSGRGPDVLDEQ